MRTINKIQISGIFIICSLLLNGSAFSQVPQSDIDVGSFIRKEFTKFNPNYKKLRNERIIKAELLGKKVETLEASGKNTICMNQVLYEIHWLLNSTADFERIDKRLYDLQESISKPEKQFDADVQDSLEGSWGSCLTEWFFKVSASYDNLQKPSNKNKIPKYECRFLDKINSPEKLTNYLSPVSISDISRTGRNNYREFNESLANLMRLIIRELPEGYSYHPHLKETLMDLILNRFRNPETGWWGERYLTDKGERFVDELSLTFHVVNYLKGNVPDMPKIIKTLLAVKDLEYPVGWLEDGQYSNHHNMDVVTLFKFGWDNESDEQKKVIAFEIEKMLHWCINESLQPDGSFKLEDGGDSIEEQNSYAISFLSRIGFFNKSNRFWTNQDFSGAEAIRQKIVAYINQHKSTGGVGGSYYDEILEELNNKPYSNNN